MNAETYFRDAAATRAERMRWWHEARFGMFVHWGLYSQLARHEWVMNRERIPWPSTSPWPIRGSRRSALPASGPAWPPRPA